MENKPEEKKEAQPAPAAATPTPPPAAAPAPAEKKIGEGKKVVLVDDDPSSLELVKGILENNGFAVVAAADGKNGLTCAAKEKPNLIIADVIMPGMDGFGLLKELKKNKETERVPILILTIRKNMEGSFLSSGADGFLAKPIDADGLLAKIKQIFSVPKAPPPAQPAAPPAPKPAS